MAKTGTPDTQSPDASLTADDSFTATSGAGLTYPWGDFEPGKGSMHPIAPGIGWARIPMPGSLGHINSWLLDDHDGVAVVDTGLLLEECSRAWKALFAQDLANKPITRVIGTHLHPDHIGLAGWLCKRFNTDLWMTRGEWLTARMLLSDVSNTPPEAYGRKQQAAGWDAAAVAEMMASGWGRFAGMVFEMPPSYRRLKEGDILDLGQHQWRIVVGSGHSPEHACLLNERQGILVSGDQVLPRISSNVSVHLTEPESDPLGDWLDSIDRLLTLPGGLLVCPAHGEPFYGLHVRLAALRDEHAQRLDSVHAKLKEQPLRAVDCFQLLFNRPIGGHNRDLATGEAVAHLNRLIHTGRAKREEENGVHWYHAA